MDSYNSFPETMDRQKTFTEWYYELRPDLLTDEELAFELKVRQINIEGDRSKLLQCLRGKLKAEKLGEEIPLESFQGHLKLQEELCRKKLVELESILRNRSAEFTHSKDRLLHLGGRLLLLNSQAEGNLKDDLETMFGIIADHLYYYFYKEAEEEDSENELHW